MSTSSGLPEHASAEKHLSSDFGVQMKKTCQYVPATAEEKEDPPSSNGIHPENSRGNNNLTGARKRKADDIATTNNAGNEQLVVCSRALHQTAYCCTGQQKLSYYLIGGIIVLFFTVLVLLLGGGGVYVYLNHIDRKYSAEVADLRQEFRRVEQLCRQGEGSGRADGEASTKFGSTGNSASDVGLDDDGRGTAGLGDGGSEFRGDSGLVALVRRRPAGALFRHRAVFNNDDEKSGDAVTHWDQRWRNDGDDDDEDDDDDSDDVGAVDEKGNENAGDENLLHRVRRSGSVASGKKPKTKPKGRKGRKCKRYTQCKQNQADGKSLKKKCQVVMDCAQKVQDSSDLNSNCKKWEHCIRKDPLPLRAGQSRVSPSPSAPQGFFPRAVHFYSDFWNDRRQQEFGRDTPLKFLQSADWMKNEYTSQSEQPIQKSNDGGFQVKQSGLYLIYSSVMFHDLKPRQASAVVVNGHKRFKCMDSVDYVDTDLPKDSNQAKYKTCSMTGVTHLSEGDRLEVQNLYDNTEIDLSTDATYFGAVLFSPGAVKGN